MQIVYRCLTSLLNEEILDDVFEEGFKSSDKHIIKESFFIMIALEHS